MAHLAAHDDICSTSSSQLQVLVILRITTFPDGLGRFDPLRSNDHDIEDSLATFDGDKSIKLRAKDHLAIFVLDRMREKQAIGRAYGTK